jgi:hypothetical protein
MYRNELDIHVQRLSIYASSISTKMYYSNLQKHAETCFEDGSPMMFSPSFTTSRTLFYLLGGCYVYIYIPLDTIKRKKLGSNLPQLRTNKWSLVFLVAWSHDVPCGAHGGCHQRSMQKNRGAGRYSHEIHHDTSFISPPVQSHDFQNLTVLIFPTQLSHQTKWYVFIEIL